MGAALSRLYPNEPIYLNDVPKNFERPSFFVAQRKRETKALNFALTEVRLTMVVACFVPVDSYNDVDREELTNRTDAVALLFGGGVLEAGDRHLLAQSAQVKEDDLQEVEIVYLYADDGREAPAASETAGDIAMRVVANDEQIPVFEIKEEKEG